MPKLYDRSKNSHQPSPVNGRSVAVKHPHTAMYNSAARIGATSASVPNRISTLPTSGMSFQAQGSGMP